MGTIKETIDDIRFRANVWGVETEFKLKKLWSENKEAILILGPGALAVCGKAIKAISKHVNANQVRNYKEKFIYNRSLGCYHELRRKPTRNEYLTIEKRKKSGEALADILESMRLLK